MSLILTAEVLTDPYTDKSVAEDPEQSKYIDVQVHPQGYVIRRVQLPRVSVGYIQPEIGSIILVFKQDDFTAKMICLLKDPPEYLTNQPLRGEGQTGDFKPGEVQFESRSKAQLYLNNQGSAKLSAADSIEQFFADTGSQTAYVRGYNVELSSNKTLTNLARIKLDKDGNILIQSIIDPVKLTERASIKIAPTGKITIQSLLSDIEIESSTGNVIINGSPNIILNNGQVGVARLGDEVQVTIPPGAISTPAPGYTNLAPIVVSGKITKASNTVKVG